MFSTSDFKYIAQEAEQIRSQYMALAQRANSSLLVDKWVIRNAQKGIIQAQDLIDAISTIERGGTPQEANRPHPLPTDDFFTAQNWGDDEVSEIVKLWRRNLKTFSYREIPQHNRKEIFDYFFRYDVHGNLDDVNTIHFSRGVNDPEYYLPPAVINAALEISSKNNWFGYSDSLGHIDTRRAIAALENVRRDQTNITYKNTAVVQGGTAGLNAVLSMIAKKSRGRTCVVVAPNYAPIIDDVENYFAPKIVELNSDYSVAPSVLFSSIDDDVAVVLMSIPHNPAGMSDFVDFLPEIQGRCAERNAYLIVDEIIFDKKTSHLFDPIRYPNLIIISSYSKTYNIPGLKLGHIVADDSFIDRFYRHASTTYGSPPSFLYFAATCLTLLEKAYRLQQHVILPPETCNEASDMSLLQEEFVLWNNLARLSKRFQVNAVRMFLDGGRSPGIERVFGLDDPSPNLILRTSASKCAYVVSLDLLSKRNISVMPIEGFAPASDWPSDIRVTIATRPKDLVDYFPQIINHLNGNHAEEKLETYLDANANKALKLVGLYDNIERVDLRTRPFNRCEQLIEICRSNNLYPDKNMLSVLALMGVAEVWLQMDKDEFELQKSRLSDAIGRKVLIEYGMEDHELSLGLIGCCESFVGPEVCSSLKNYFLERDKEDVVVSEVTSLMSYIDVLAKERDIYGLLSQTGSTEANTSLNERNREKAMRYILSIPVNQAGRPDLNEDVRAKLQFPNLK